MSLCSGRRFTVTAVNFFSWVSRSQTTLFLIERTSFVVGWLVWLVGVVVVVVVSYLSCNLAHSSNTGKANPVPFFPGLFLTRQSTIVKTDPITTVEVAEMVFDGIVLVLQSFKSIFRAVSLIDLLSSKLLNFEVPTLEKAITSLLSVMQ